MKKSKNTIKARGRVGTWVCLLSFAPFAFLFFAKQLGARFLLPVFNVSILQHAFQALLFNYNAVSWCMRAERTALRPTRPLTLRPLIHKKGREMDVVEVQKSSGNDGKRRTQKSDKRRSECTTGERSRKRTKGRREPESPWATA
jgi:hypothetical protein